MITLIPLDQRRVALIAVLLSPLPFLMFGCYRRDEVRVFSIPKQEQAPASPVATPIAAGPNGPDQGAKPLQARMLAAIVRGGSQDWFFKMLGDPAQVDGAVEQFKSLLSSLEINSQGQPSWKLPEGWTEEPAQGIRLATIRTGNNPGAATISVVGLAPGQDSLDNVNRWRDQMQLDPLDAKQLGEAVEKIDAGDLRVELFDMAGTVDTSNPMVGPFASAAGMPNPHVKAKASNQGASAAVLEPRGPAQAAGVQPNGLSYSVPPNWKEQPATGMRRAYLSVTDGDKSVDITVITLSLSSVIDNVNRWRNELQLSPITESDLDQHSAQLNIGGESGHWIERMESQSDPRRGTIAAMVEHGGQMWFFKMTGPAELVAREEANFRAFVQSVKF